MGWVLVAGNGNSVPVSATLYASRIISSMPIRPNRHQRDLRQSLSQELRRTSETQRQARSQMRDRLRDHLDELRLRARHGQRPEFVWERLERATPRAQREVARIVAAAIEVADQ